jgi:pimeloyl-ACP methyl ester carboxylesterase
VRRALALALVLALGSGSSVQAEEITACEGLAGTFVSPGPAGVAVLIVAGSGPTDRNGDSPLGITAASYRLLAEGLASAGVGSLRYDKRGIGASAPVLREEDVTFASSAADVRCLRDWLANRPGVGRVALLGHSEGGIHVTTVALDTGDDIVLVTAPGRNMRAVIADQIAAAGAPEAARALLLDALDRIGRGETVDAPPAFASLLRRSVQPFVRDAVRTEPAELLARHRGRALVIAGETDIQASALDFERLRAARPDVESTMIPGMNHALKLAPAERAANLAAYQDPSRPLAPGLLERIVDFLRP